MTRDMARQVLGVDRGASEREIRAAWKGQVKRYHPDRGGSAEKLILANLAYELLTVEAAEPGSGTPRADMRSDPRRDAPERRRGRRAVPGAVPVPCGARARGRAQLEAVQQRRAFSDAIRGNGGFYVDPRRVRAGVGAGHVASGVETDGRWVLFVVDAPMQEGDNLVALPLGDRAGDRPVVVSFETARRGGGRIVLDEAERKAHFPWAEAVEIAFRAGCSR